MNAPDRRRKALFAVKTVVTCAVLALIVWKLGWRQIVVTVRSADPWWIGAALLLFFVSGWLGVFQWQVILKNRGVDVDFSRAFKLYFIGLFFNNFALGIIAGDAVKVAYLKMRNGKGTIGLAATFLDRFAGLWAMLGFAVVGSMLLMKQKTLESRSLTIAVVALFVTFVLFCGIMVYLISPRLQALTYRLLDRVSFWQKQRVRSVIEEAVIEAHDRHIILPVALISFVVQFMRILVHICCAGALGLLSAANVHYFFIFVPIIGMIMVVPLPFGIRESVGGTLFTMAGFEMNAAVVMGFLASIVGIAASLVGGYLFMTGRSTKENAVPPDRAPGVSNTKDRA